MNIYPSTKVRPYVYICSNRETGEFYIGYREANKLPSHIDFPLYQTSSKIVKQHFNNYDWYIVAEFELGNDAYDFEQQLIFENWSNLLLLNQRCYYQSTERFKVAANRAPFSKTWKENMSRSKLGIKRKPFTEITLHRLSISNIGKHNITNETREKLIIARNKRAPPSLESRAKNGSSHRGQKRSETAKNNMRKPKTTMTCPHCGLVGGSNGIKRYHNDKCKKKVN